MCYQILKLLQVWYASHYADRHGLSRLAVTEKDIDGELGVNCIQNFHLARYIVGYMVGNLDLRRRASGAVKRDFRTYIRRYTSPNENFEYVYPHSNAHLQYRLKF